MKERLLGKSPDELKNIALEAGLPAFAGKQIAQWLYQKRVSDISEMTNLSRQGREVLSEKKDLRRVKDLQTLLISFKPCSLVILVVPKSTNGRNAN